jgi:hypothetical protein
MWKHDDRFSGRQALRRDSCTNAAVALGIAWLLLQRVRVETMTP